MIRRNLSVRVNRRIFTGGHTSKSVDPDLIADSATSSQFDILTLISVGGAIGVLARYGIASAFPVASREIPWSTLAINLAGSFLLGIVFIVVEHRPTNRFLRPFLVIGIIGGFTTFSTFAVEVVQLIRDRPWIALIYLTISVGGGALSVLVGGSVVRRLYIRALNRRPGGNRTPSSS